MIKKVFILNLIIYCTIANVLANEAILKGLFEAQENLPQSDVGPEKASPLENTTSMTATSSCSVEDQTSLPLKFVMGLLRDKGSSLVPSHNSDTGELTIYGGRMIGNCNSMLDYVISPPEGNVPYVFQVKIKACGEPKCAYRVRTMEKGSPVVVNPTPKFEPNMRGFEACLKATGVLTKDNGVAKDKIVNEEFKATVRGVTETSKIWFASHGPFQSQVYGSEGNLKPGHGCYYFENIQEQGFNVYSRADVERNRATDRLKSICESGNYKLIDERISDFSQFGDMQKLMVQARNRMLLEQYATLHEKLNQNDYSEINVEEVENLIGDFQSYILGPLKNKIRETYRLMANSSGQAKRNYQKDLDILVDQFKSYAVSPYPNSSDLQRMQDFKRKAPIDDEHWSNAVLNLNRVQNTIAVYQQYKGPGQKESPIIADRRINEAQGKFAREYAILRKLASDPNYSHVGELRRKRNNLHRAVVQSQMELQRDVQGEVAYIQKHCYGKYYIRSNPISLRNCVGEAQANIQAWQEETYSYAQRNSRIAKQLDEEATQWSRVEQKRNSSNSGGDQGQGRAENGNYRFNFDNSTTRTGSGPGAMPSQMQPNFQYPAMWGQNQPNFGANRNFFPGQYNMGYQNPSFGFGGQMGGRFPAQQPGMPGQYGGFPQSPYGMGYGGQMPPVYGNHMMSGQYYY